jgi:hypothetical protein
MPSGTDRLGLERARMATFRKEAGLVGSALTHSAHGAENLGRGIWQGAKAVGGGSALGGAGVLGAAGLSSSVTVPQMASAAKETYAKVHDPQTALALGGMK